MPFCKGCGHTHVLRKLNDALIQLQFAPTDVCFVTDIGCIGLADVMFETVHTVHTTHGRSMAFATGISLADSLLSQGKLKTIVLIGDGGAMIGLLHLVEAAQLNVDMTVLLCNNFLFGMTGGQHSAFSPLDFLTPTTPKGNITPPIDMCNVLLASGATYVARKLATDKSLTETIAEAITHPGFSIVEIVELCTEHATTRNEITGVHLTEVLTRHNQTLGVLLNETERGDFSFQYSGKYPANGNLPFKMEGKGIVPSFTHSLQNQIGIVLAGSAGERVQSSAKKFCEAAMRCGLSATQKNDNPITQGSGFSLSEIVLSPSEIFYTGIDEPDVVIVVSHDGMKELEEKEVFSRLLPTSILLLDEEIEPPALDATIVRYPFRKEFGGKDAALKALEHYLGHYPVFPKEAFHIS